MNIFRDRYWTYDNFKSMYYKTRKYTFGKVFEYNTNKPIQIINKTNILLEGGEDIKQIVEKYSDIVNIQIDKTESDEIELMVVNINSQITCGMVVLDKKRKIATIHDLISDISCLKRHTSKSVMEKIIEIIKKICKKMGMKYIVLTDDAYHTCRGTRVKYDLNTGNTITSGYPYYYKYGFQYEDSDNHLKAITNADKIRSTKTEVLTEEYLLNMLEYVFKNEKKSKEEIKEIKDQVIKLYNENKENNIGTFMKELKYSNCYVFAKIYLEIYKMLELGIYMNSNKLMYYKL